MSISGNNIAVVTVGKFQGPHFGHRVLIQKVADIAEEVGGTPFIFTSTSKDIITKPHFKISEKLQIMRKMFSNIVKPENIKEGSIRNVFGLAKEGYDTIYILAGSDRLKTKEDCEAEFGIDTKEFKKCWNNSFLKSVIPSLEKSGITVKTVIAGEERGSETAEGAPSGKNFRAAASSLVSSHAIANKERAEATLTRLMNEGSAVKFSRSEILKHAKTMVNNTGKTGKGGYRTRRREKKHRRRKTRRKQRRYHKTIKKIKKKKKQTRRKRK